MSAVGEARQPAPAATKADGAGPGRRAAWRIASWPAGAVRALLGSVLVVAGLLSVVAIGLAWRLAQGPLEVTWLLRAAEPLMTPGDTAARISVGRAFIAWNGFKHGAHSGLELRLQDIRAADSAGVPRASIAQADVTLAPGPLLAVTVAPRRIVLDGVHVRAVRGADGAVRLDVGSPSAADRDPGPGNGLHDMLAELRRPVMGAVADPTRDATLGALEQVVVAHATLTLMDEASGTALEGEIADLDLRRRDGGGISGGATGRFVVGGAALALAMRAEVLDDGRTHLEATLAPLGTRTVDTAAFIRLDPALAILGGLDAALEAQASLDLSPTLRPQAATLQASTGPGTLAVPNSVPVAFDRAALTASARWDETSWRPAEVTVHAAEFVLVAGGTRRSTVRLTAAGSRQDGQIVAKTTLGFDRAQFGDLPALWPAAWGGHVRPWLTDNVTSGTVHDAAFTATIGIPETDPAGAKVMEAGGTMQADNVVIHWLRPVPPIEHAQATLTVTGPDDLVISVPKANQGPIALRDGVLRFTGLSQKDQYLALTATVQGGVPDVVKLLREPRLQLLSAHPLSFTASAGRALAQLSVNVPMFDHLTFDQVSIASKGRLTGFRLAGSVAGRDIERGDFGFEVTQDGLNASGAATVAGIAGRAEVAMNFKAGPPSELVQQARLVGRAGAAELAANGVDLAGVLTGGAAMIDVGYEEQRDGVARVSVKADLGPAGLSVLGWHKAPGLPARAAASVTMLHGVVISVPALSASGPGMSVAAQAEMADGAARVLRFDRVALGPTRLGGEIVFPAEPSGPIRVQASGPVLDLSGQIGRLTAGGGHGGTRSWIGDVRFGRVLLGNGRALTDVAAHAEQIGGRLRSLQATTGGKEQVRASITPVENGRRLLVQSADVGALLRGLDLTRSIEGGALSVDARYDDRQADPPLEGRVQLGSFAVKDAVVVGKLLQAVTIYGIADALRDKGVYFSELQAPFCWCDNVLRLGQSRAFSSSLGITAQGWVDFNRKVMELNGTVVPAYAVNAALGRIPLVGRLFSPERGGGLIAANFSVTGPTANPGVSVNPFSLLTPGFLRGLFALFS